MGSSLVGGQAGEPVAHNRRSGVRGQPERDRGPVPAGVGPAGVGPAGVDPAGVDPAGVGPAGVGPAGVALLGLQRGRGNRHVQRVLARIGRDGRNGPVLQASLVVGAAGDRYEREAERVAAMVERGRHVSVGRMTAPPCPLAHRSAAGTEPPRPAGGPSVERAVAMASGGGRRIPDAVRAPMEHAFGADFGSVRVHADARSDRLSRSLHAHALTTGTDIFFRRGRYAPSTAAGRRLLAHELAHVVQQDRGATGVVQRKVGYEFEAQWNVRDVSSPTAKADFDTATAGYENDVRVTLLRQMVDLQKNAFRGAGHPLRLSDAERARAGALEDEWIAGDRPTAAGRARLDAVRLCPGEQAWDEAVMSLLITSQVPERPLFGANLAKGRTPAGTVVNGTRFDLTADASPTGGSNLEWVTDALETRGEVEAVMADITSMVTYLNGRRNDAFIPSEDVTAGGGRPRPGLRIYPLNQEQLRFAPQITGGLRIDRIPKLIDFLGRSKGHGARARNDLFLEMDPVRLSLDAARAAVRTDRRLTGMKTKGLVGLLAVVGSYLRNGGELPDQANSKSIAGGMMARTDFAFNFALLPADVAAHVAQVPRGGRLPRFVSLAMASAGLSDRDADGRVFENTVERGLAGARETTTVPLTRRQWLEGILAGTDLLRNWKRLGEADQAALGGYEREWTAVHGSLGALGDTRELVGRPDARVPAIIVELRRMRADLYAKDLTGVALATFDLIERLNLKKKLKYGG